MENLAENIELINEAERLIQDAIFLIEEAVHGTNEQAVCDAYIIPSLATWIGNGNPYDHHTGKIIEALREEAEEDEGDDFTDPAGGSGLHSHI